MSFDPVLQARIDAVRPKLGGGEKAVAGELGDLKAKLAARDGAGGFSQNVAELRGRIEAMETET